FDRVLGQRRRGLYDVRVLQTGDGLLLLAVDPHVAAYDPQRVARDGDAAFDVVLAFVHGARDDRVVVVEPAASLRGTVGLGVAAQDIVVGNVLVFEQHGVARREVEDHHVVAADAAQTFQPVVGPLDGFGERFFRL